MNRKKYNRLIKIIISNLFFLVVLLNQNAISKPVPPGSGEGDVPANILILLDSSASMKRNVFGGNGIDNPHSITADSDGNVYVGEGKLGVVKFLLADKSVDATFAKNNRNYMGYSKDPDCDNKNTTIKNVTSLGITSNDIIYAMATNDNGKVIGIDTNGVCVDASLHKLSTVIGMKYPKAMAVQLINGEDHIFITGRKWASGGVKRFLFTKNLTTGDTEACLNQYGGGALGTTVQSSVSLTVDKDGDYIYFARGGNIEGFKLTKTGNNYCPATSRIRHYRYDDSSSTKHRKAVRIQMSRDDVNVMYVTSHVDLVQKIEITGHTSLNSKAIAGRNSSTSHKDDDPGTLTASTISLKDPTAIAVTSTGLYVGTKNNTVQEFSENNFTAANVDTSWQRQYGGQKATRYEGAKAAIRAVVNDSTLTSGANFGYGHWNSGEIGSGRKVNEPPTPTKGGYECHQKYSDCQYYRGWQGEHPTGTSELCNSDSCLLVGISEISHTAVPAALDAYGMEWGTDANAFAQMASKYFRESGIVDEDSECQLNYVVVIGDGAWKHHTEALSLIKSLRTDLKVKTIVVAYGGGIKGGAMTNFDKMAVAGSCDTAGGTDCHTTIVADTPQQLKTQLQSKIRQIIAERLSFTAPSITATIQEGGSIYQAQFNYEQHGEWQGTILKKTLREDGTVDHDTESAGNWDAAKVLKDRGSGLRNIWTVIEGVSYYGNWNNWSVSNNSDIGNLFEETGNEVVDYHNTSSKCGAVSGVEDGTDDDIDGLINFVRGKDYFDYNGNCIITEEREHLLGDIYHSQLVDVGPPNAKTQFSSSNQEGYWRTKNNYRSFKSSHQNRERIIYAGGNDGMLHAFNSEDGVEEWAFIPPFIAAKLPIIIQPDLDGTVGVQNGGGTNPIFAVDGSPVVHDMFIRGLNSSATDFEIAKSWRTIMVIPYGRGGNGFSVLDVTNPIINASQGPLHMYSIFNDVINHEVLVADYEGKITSHTYERALTSISESEEAGRASRNQNTARDEDGEDCDSTDTDAANNCTAQDLIYECQSNSDASGSFRAYGTSACYRGTTFTFTNINPPTIDDDNNVDKDKLKITETVSGDTQKLLDIESAKITSGKLVIKFKTQKTYNLSASHLVEEDRATNNIQIATSCEGNGTVDKDYDYSQLGETWSTPRIFRIPSKTGDSNMDNDRYIAVMGGGYGVNTMCVGSNLFIVDLEDTEKPGKIYGADKNNGPIIIVDTDPEGINPGTDTYVATPNGSDIPNATPASPIVITPDNVKGIPWRGAMVYLNDIEGKITKFNLTSSTENGAKLFDQTTLYNLNANITNSRYSYHAMDVTIGTDTKNLWLFGSTGNFTRISSTGNPNGDMMENILYGIRDVHFPHFKHLNSSSLPLSSDNNFVKMAAEAASKAFNIDSNDTRTLPGIDPTCINTTDDAPGSCKIKSSDLAWVIYLDKPDGLPLKEKDGGPTKNRFRKASASPTVFKGQVYFPIYEPDKEDLCGLGKAFICSAEDECGTNSSHKISGTGSIPEGDDCYYVKRGILSKLVVGTPTTLFANVAGPSESEETLISILSDSTDFSTYRRSWRENY